MARGGIGVKHEHSLGILNQVGGFWIYLIMFLLILVQEIGVPVPILPSEVVLLGGGFLANQGKITFPVMVALLTVATLLGNSLLFYIGRRYGRAALVRYGKHIHLHPERIDRIEAWIGSHGRSILIYGPLLPVLRAYIPALAGVFGVPFRYYISVLVFAALVWSAGLMGLGYALGDHWFDVVTFLRRTAKIVTLLLVLAGVAAIVVLRLRRRAAERAALRTWKEVVPSTTVQTTRLRPPGDIAELRAGGGAGGLGPGTRVLSEPLPRAREDRAGAARPREASPEGAPQG